MKHAHVRLLLFEDRLVEALLSSSVLHRDATVMRCEGKTQWTHSVSNDRLTFYCLDEQRGTEAINRAGILPLYKGHLVHDRYASYFQYDQMDHSLCNAHLLRELKYLQEENCAWAMEIMDLLLKAKQHKEQSPVVSKTLKITSPITVCVQQKIQVYGHLRKMHPLRKG